MLTMEQIQELYDEMRETYRQAEEEAVLARERYHQARFREACLRARIARAQNRTRERTRQMMAAEAQLQEAREREWRAEHYIGQRRAMAPDEELLDFEEIIEDYILPEPPVPEIPTPPPPPTRRVLSPRHFVPIASSTPA